MQRKKESILKEVLTPYYESFPGLSPVSWVRRSSCLSMLLPLTLKLRRSGLLRRLFKKTNYVSMKVNVKLRQFGFLLSLLTIAEREPA